MKRMVLSILLCAARAAAATLTPASHDFGVYSMGTSPPTFLVATFRNDEASAITVTGVSVSNADFSQFGSCPNAQLAPGQSCLVNVFFTPRSSAGPVGERVAMSATLTLTHSGSVGPQAIALSGTAERSLLHHYYAWVLRRAPNAAETSYWLSEAQRTTSLGANPREVWYAMAMAFLNSGEFAANNYSGPAGGFVPTLYRTFLNRFGESSGVQYWEAQIAAGMPREVVLASFLFSAEFGATVAGIFGEVKTPPENDTVMDFYRGLLARLPDSAGYSYWLQRLRSARCSGESAVYTEVEAISSYFTSSSEYAARARSNAQYVGDLYNAFLRRGGDLDGVRFWIGQLDSGARTRERVRQDFLASPEFSARVRQIVAGGCNA